MQAEFEKAFFADLNALLTQERRRNIASCLNEQLVNETRKRATPQLQAQLKEFGERIERMTEGLMFGAEKGQIVVNVRGSDEMTLKLLRFGSDWFEGNNLITETILAGLSR